MRKLFFALLLTACSDYKLTNRENPFRQFGVITISVPTFYNHSNLPMVSMKFTKEIVTYLREFPGLKVVNQVDSQADAVLIGIISSAEKRSHTIRPEDYRVTNDVAPTSVDRTIRGEFYVPAITSVNLSVRFLLIKNPTEVELKLLKSELGKKVPEQANIILNKEFAVTGRFNREIFDGESTNVNGTQNSLALQRVLLAMAKKTKDNFEEVVLYAF
jgi:hypothetical protein